VLLVFGTRPEAIKMAPLVKEFMQYPDFFITKVCVTAQHRQMLDQVLAIFEIKPDYDLNIMSHHQDLYDVTAKVLLKMREVLDDFLPDLVLVHGDTTTSIASAIASFYKQITVGHVEAGLRTHDMYNPWPEEMNRLLISRIAQYNFCPTVKNKQNLLDEKIDESKIIVTGNTVIDALQMATNIIGAQENFKTQLQNIIISKGLSNGLLESWEFYSRKMILITGHRRENFGAGFLNVCNAIKTLSKLFPGVDFVYPVHLNPNVQKPVHKLLKNIDNIHLLPPLDYLPFILLMQYSYLILTDSGGVQEEAPGLGKPVLVMRHTTERPEAVEAGTVRLVGTNADSIISNVSRLINSEDEYNAMSKSVNPYGDGEASWRIVEFLKHI